MKSDLVYTRNPDLSFDGKRFCLTGKFDGHGRPQLERSVAAKGGTFTPSATEETDYLVIGSLGTRCCSFACCTRVVEKAVALKKNGAPIQFIAESDFLAALNP